MLGEVHSNSKTREVKDISFAKLSSCLLVVGGVSRGGVPTYIISVQREGGAIQKL